MSSHIEDIDPDEIVDAMAAHAAQAADAIHRCRVPLAAAIETGASALRRGGRILYFGAGTSGRLGVLDASECPPTFGVDPDRVVGVMAGGDSALRESIEGAEDDAAAGAQAVTDHGVNHSDFVVGIAASGRTPYVMGALEAARASGAKTALLSANINPQCAVDIAIALQTGAELIPGSTRLKAGTATKLALNAISTGAFAQAGYVYKGRMIAMRPTNEKLRARAARIVAELTGESEASAQAWLEQTGYNIVAAILVGRDGVEPGAAMAAVHAAAAPADALR